MQHSNKKYGLKIATPWSYYPGLLMQLLLIYIAISNDWNFYAIISIFVIEAIIVGTFGLIEIILKAKNEDSAMKGIGHGLFYFGHFLLVHIVVLAMLYIAEFGYKSIPASDSFSGFFPMGTNIAVLGIFLSYGVYFISQVVIKKRYLAYSYAHLHINQYTHHILPLSYLMLFPIGLLRSDYGTDLSDLQISNAGLIIAFFATKILIEFIVSNVRLHPNSPETNLRVTGQTTPYK